MSASRVWGSGVNRAAVYRALLWGGLKDLMQEKNEERYR